MKIVRSTAGVPIRLTAERMSHIEQRHPEMTGEEAKILETVEAPLLVQEGDAGTLIALRHYSRTPLGNKYCAVVYKEVSPMDGFVVTAYFTEEPRKGRRVVWQP